jgi:small subunit ribosomal protein S1
MSEQVERPTNENFAQMVESYDAQINADVRVGDKITGQIISISADNVFVNTGTKIDGVVEKKELLDDNGQFVYQEGDTLDLYVMAVNENDIRLSKALSGVGGLNLLRDAFQDKIPVQGKVKEQCKGGFTVDILQHRAFCPISQIDIRYTDKPEEYVGGNYPFLIMRFENNGRNIVVSRRELFVREQEEAKKKFFETLAPGVVLTGKIRNLMPYGAFVELFPGIEGMVHVSELSWSRVEKPEEAVNSGDEITVKVLSVEKGEKDQLKISLSAKQVGGNPWETGEQAFKAGDKIRGKVTRCADFGAFVEIAPGIEGLVHVSEISYTKRILKPEDVLKPGDMVDLMVKDVDMSRKRISLSIRDAEGDPWIGIKEKYPVGKSITGILEKREKFGFFITLEPGITGLLPKSKISRSENSSAVEKLKVGDSVTVTVEEVKTRERKISLGLGGEEKSEEDWRKYTKGTPSSLGSLGEKLQQAMMTKK